MKKSIVTGIVLCFTRAVFTVAAFDADSVFNHANREYIGENYGEAIKKYEEVLSMGYESAELYYNLGNAFFRIGNYPRSILFYEKALLHDPRNKNIQFNLAKAQFYIVDRIDEIPEFIIKKWWYTILSWFHADTWGMISLVSFIMSMLGFILYLLVSNYNIRRTGFYIFTVLLIVSVISFSLAFRAKSILIKSNGAIVLTPAVIVKGSPSVTSTDLFVIHEGSKVYILDELNDWFEIKLSDGKQGWLLKSDIEPI